MPYAEACQNLRLYLRQAMLPTMGLRHGCPPVPQEDKQATDRYLLSTEPDARRKLQLVLHLVPDLINKRVTSFIDKAIPNKPIVGAHDYSDERAVSFYIPAPSFDFDCFLPSRIIDMQSMAAWMNMALLTAERAVCVVWPEETKGYCLTTQKPGHPAENADIYKAFFWRKTRGVDQEDVKEPNFKLVIASLAPWALTPEDMLDFACTSRFPAFSVGKGPAEGPATYTRAQKIWAKVQLWDDCTRKNCPYFVVSVYHGWIFGVFVKGWTTALISTPVAHLDTRPDPTVLQWLVFWFAASMGLPGAWVAPPLKRFINPDIRTEINVAYKLSHLQVPDEEEPISHSNWLEECHKQECSSKSGRTTDFPGLDNTWLMKF